MLFLVDCAGRFDSDRPCRSVRALSGSGGWRWDGYQHGSGRQKASAYTCVFPLPVSIWEGISGVSRMQHGRPAYRNNNVLLEALLEHLELVGPGRHGHGGWGFLVG